MIQLAVTEVFDVKPALIAAAILSLVFYFLGVATYRLYVHPLASVPGPFFTRISSWPNWYHAAKGDRHVWLYRLHSQYASIVRFAPDSVSFNTPSAIDSIYRSRTTNVIKSDWYQCVRESAGGFESTFTARDKVRHGIKRRLLSHAFSERALRDYEPRIANLMSNWLECLEAETESCGGSIDMGAWSVYLIFDILGDLCFGKAFGLMASTEDRSIAGLVPRATQSWYKLGYHPLTHLLRFLLFRTRLGPIIGGQSFRDNARFRSFCLRTLKERKQAEEVCSNEPQTKDNKDMFHHLLNGVDPETGDGYNTGDLACESVLLIVAGSQSTSGALAATVFYLASNPEKLARLRAEIHDAFSTESAIRYEAGGKLATLPYLRACIDESMRLTPPTPGHLPREILGAQGLSIDGVWFPPTTKVGTSAYALHRNESYFGEPGRFWPERWIGHEEESYGDKKPATSFNPFSAGATGCIGRQLAMMELSLAVAMLVWRFDLIMQPKDDNAPDEYRVRDFFVGEGEGPLVQLIPCHP